MKWSWSIAVAADAVADEMMVPEAAAAKTRRWTTSTTREQNRNDRKREI